MAFSADGRSATGNIPSPNGTGSDESRPIKAVRLRHPVRNIIAVIIVVYFAAFLWDASQRPQLQWSLFAKYVFDRRISEAAVNTPS